MAIARVVLDGDTLVYMSTHPVAVRFDEPLLEAVRRWAKSQSVSVSSAVQTFVAEGLRMRQVPGIVFRDGPTGSRAAVSGGPDVWEVIEAIQGVPAPRGGVDGLADELELPVRTISIGLDYYAKFPAEIDQQIAQNAAAADLAEAEWRRRRALVK